MNNTEQFPDARAEIKSLGPKRKALLSIFLSFYVACLWLMACPHQWTQIRRVLMPMKNGLEYLGVWSDPRLFAPDPPLEHQRYDFQITFKDGSVVHWKYPVDGTFVFDKRLYARLLAMYMRHGPQYHSLYTGFAQYLVREYHTTSQIPVAVEIVYHGLPIARSGEKQAVPLPDESLLLWHYTVLPEDLQ